MHESRLAHSVRRLQITKPCRDQSQNRTRLRYTHIIRLYDFRCPQSGHIIVVQSSFFPLYYISMVPYVLYINPCDDPFGYFRRGGQF